MAANVRIVASTGKKIGQMVRKERVAKRDMDIIVYKIPRSKCGLFQWDGEALVTTVRHRYDSIFYSIQLSLRKYWFWLNLWLTVAFNNWFKSTHDSKWFSGIWFKLTHDSKGLPEFRFKSTHDSKSFPEFWFKSTHDSKAFQNFDSNHLTTQKPF